MNDTTKLELTIGDASPDGLLTIEDTSWTFFGDLKVTVRDRTELPRTPERTHAARNLAYRALADSRTSRLERTFTTSGPSVNYVFVISDRVS